MGLVTSQFKDCITSTYRGPSLTQGQCLLRQTVVPSSTEARSSIRQGIFSLHSEILCPPLDKDQHPTPNTDCVSPLSQGLSQLRIYVSTIRQEPSLAQGLSSSKRLGLLQLKDCNSSFLCFSHGLRWSRPNLRVRVVPLELSRKPSSQVG